MSVTLNYGVNSIETSTFSGKSVCDAAKFALEFLGAPKEATIKVNGQEVYDASILLEDGDVVEFVKVSGEKGAGMICVIVRQGVNQNEIPVQNGATIEDVVNRASNIFGYNIRDNSSVYLNGEGADMNTRITSGDVVEIRKQAGEKGI